jgi:hemolysin activation/secretion protein
LPVRLSSRTESLWVLAFVLRFTTFVVAPFPQHKEAPERLDMGGDIRERVEALRREIAPHSKVKPEVPSEAQPHPVAASDHVRRQQRLKQIMRELKSMTDWKKP